MSARETILGRVRAALGDAQTDQHEEPRGETDGDVRAEVDYNVASPLGPEQTIERFVERISEYGAHVSRVARNEVAVSVAQICAAQSARRIGIPPDLPGSWRPPDVDLAPDHELSPEDLDALDGALTECTLAIAETGTVVLTAAPEDGRRALTLVPDLHICVLLANRIVGSVPQGIRALEPVARMHGRPVTFVSGPSATSDIELSRVEGVHGPRRLEIVLVA